MSRLRRIIHANPELSFREYQTAALVADTLAEIGGYTNRPQGGQTGVGAALGDGSMEQAPRRRQTEQRPHAHTASGLAEDRHVGRVATEGAVSSYIHMGGKVGVNLTRELLGQGHEVPRRLRGVVAPQRRGESDVHDPIGTTSR